MEHDAPKGGHEQHARSASSQKQVHDDKGPEHSTSYLAQCTRIAAAQPPNVQSDLGANVRKRSVFLVERDAEILRAGALEPENKLADTAIIIGFSMLPH